MTATAQSGWTAALLVVVLAATAHCVSAQATQPGVRRGFWIEGGAGTGTVRSACTRCTSATASYGTSNHLRLGGSLSPRVLLGVEFFSLRSPRAVLTQGAIPVKADNGSIAPVVIWYAGRSGFFLKGGAGLARGTFTVRPEGGGTVALERRMGSAITFSVGLDTRIASWLALTGNLGTYVTAVGDVNVHGTTVDDFIATVYEASVGVTVP